MKNYTTSSLVPNLHELHQPPFLRRQTYILSKFKNKEKYLQLFRNLTYKHPDIFSKIFIYGLSQQKKEKKLQRYLTILTEKDIITVEQLYQLLNQNISQKQFSGEVQKIKQYQSKMYNYVDGYLNEHLLEFPDKSYLTFCVYKKGKGFCLKAGFNSYGYQFKHEQSQVKVPVLPEEYIISSALVREEISKKFEQVRVMSENIPVTAEVQDLYDQFYQQTYFLYDEFILKLQVYHNYPLLRIKNYLPIKFIDQKTNQPLSGPIFSNSHSECMYGHFNGYNADSIKYLEREVCSQCLIPINQFEENQLLMMLRDNVFNPCKNDIFYFPENNRFKLWTKRKVMLEQGDSSMPQQKQYIKTEIVYLNYHHFKTNIKKMSGKKRTGFTTSQVQQIFPLSFRYLNRNMLIMEPARGRYCQHFSFTDLRLYYLSHNPQNNTYSCPIEGCNEVMSDNDILYLKETVCLLEYIKMKCEKCMDLSDISKLTINNPQSQIFINYKVRQDGNVMSKTDELPNYYKTLVDPYIPFAEYSLGIKEKKYKEFKEKYMFNNYQEEMEAEEEVIQEEDEEF